MAATSEQVTRTMFTSSVEDLSATGQKVAAIYLVDNHSPMFVTMDLASILVEMLFRRIHL